MAIITAPRVFQPLMLTGTLKANLHLPMLNIAMDDNRVLWYNHRVGREMGFPTFRSRKMGSSEKPNPPTGAALYSHKQPNNSIAKSLEVYDDAGQAFIIKQLPNGKWISWHCSNRTAAEWTEMNNSLRHKVPFTIC